MPSDAELREMLARERADALAKALCLLDSFAGEGIGHVYGNGSEIHADDVCTELTSAFGVELEPGWWRALGEQLGQALTRIDALEKALAPFAKIVPSSLYPADGSEAEAYCVLLAPTAGNPVEFTGADLARARTAIEGGKP